MSETARSATTPTIGGLRDAFLGFAAGAAAAYVTTRTGSPELGDTTGQAVQQVGTVAVGALTAVTMGFITLGRKAVMDWLAKRAQS